jgi:hypothetical protein
MTYVDSAIARGKADYEQGKPLSANFYRNVREDKCGPQMRHWWAIGWRVAQKSAMKALQQESEHG